jgi:hypothetical protein
VQAGGEVKNPIFPLPRLYEDPFLKDNEKLSHQTPDAAAERGSGFRRGVFAIYAVRIVSS